MNKELIKGSTITLILNELSKEPMYGYKKIGHLNKGTKVEIVTKLSNGWYKIKFNSSYGYVSGDYVKLI